MPNGDGRWLIQRLQAEPDMADITIIVISGQIARETFEGGPISISGKHFTATETLDYLRALLATTPPTGVNDDTTAQPLITAHPV